MQLNWLVHKSLCKSGCVLVSITLKKKVRLNFISFRPGRALGSLPLDPSLACILNELNSSVQTLPEYQNLRLKPSPQKAGPESGWHEYRLWCWLLSALFPILYSNQVVLKLGYAQFPFGRVSSAWQVFQLQEVNQKLNIFKTFNNILRKNLI